MCEVQLSGLIWRRPISLSQHALVHLAKIDAKTIMIDGGTAIIEVAIPAC